MQHPLLVNAQTKQENGNYDFYVTLGELNAFHAAGECRRQVKIEQNLVENVNIMECYDQAYIWNHHEKCIQIITNMPSIGLVIPEINCEMLEF